MSWSASAGDIDRLLPYLRPEFAARYQQMLGGPAVVGGMLDATPAAPPAPGTPYTGPKPYIAGAYNTLAPSDYAAYQASLQPKDPNWVAPVQQPLPGLLDPNAVDVNKLFDPDRMRGAWSGGEGGGGNGGGQR